MIRKDYCRNISQNETVSYGEGGYVILKQSICRLDERKPTFTLKKQNTVRVPDWQLRLEKFRLK